MEQKKIFIVDDNTVNLMMCKNALKDSYSAFTMPSANKMFEMLGSVRPDLILLDIEMPETDGREAFKKLKTTEYANIPVAFLSGNDDAAEKEQLLGLGAADYITKPFNPEDLIARVKKIIG